MKRHVKRTAFFVVGVFFVLLGIAGLALPFLQGFLFIAVGLILLSISSTRARAWIESHTRRYPKVHAAFGKLEHWILGIVGPLDVEKRQTTGDSIEHSDNNKE